MAQIRGHFLRFFSQRFVFLMMVAALLHSQGAADSKSGKIVSSSVIATAAAADGSDSPPVCRSADDCNLLGRCNTSDGTCSCYRGFTGQHCERLDLKPLAHSNLDASAWQYPLRDATNVSAWGISSQKRSRQLRGLRRRRFVRTYPSAGGCPRKCSNSTGEHSSALRELARLPCTCLGATRCCPAPLYRPKGRSSRRARTLRCE